MSGKKKKKEIELDDFHYHEALDRTFLVTQVFSDFVLDHPVIEKHKDVQKLLADAGTKLGRAYQLIGQYAYEHGKEKIKKEILNGH